MAVPPPGKKSFALRLDPAVHAAVERLAAAELRSVNGQIEFLLREALKSRGVKVEAKPDGKPDLPPRSEETFLRFAGKRKQPVARTRKSSRR